MGSLFFLSAGLLFFFFPFLRSPDLLLNRNNDLLWFSKSFRFFQDQVLNYHHLPLWQNYILSGSPFLGDPQNPLLYLPNYLSLLLPLPAFFLTFFLLHFFLALIGTYFLARKLNFPITAALFSALVYAFSPVFSAHLAEGHLNMLAAFAWFPLLLAGLYTLLARPKFSSAILTGLSAAAIFLNYLTIFVYTVPAGIILAILKPPFRQTRTTLKLLALSGLFFLIISLPQVLIGWEYFPLTTRGLTGIADIIPQFLSFRRFLYSLINPFSFQSLGLGPETVLAPGILPVILAALGFFFLKRRYKILLLVYLPLALFLALNLKTPGYSWLVTVFPVLLLFRVATRFWFVNILLISLLGGYFLKKLTPKYQLGACLLVLAELTLFCWSYFHSTHNTHVPNADFSKLLAPLLTPPGYFRIYCTTGCPEEIYLPNKGTAGGYSPTQMRNYYDYIIPAAGYRFNLYTYSLPPYQTFPDKPQPLAQALGLLGVKYLFSPYPLTDPELVLAGQENNLYLYENTRSRPRVFTISGSGRIEPLTVTRDRPGEMEVSLDPDISKVYINEPYSPLWQAFDQNRQLLPVTPSEQILLSVRTNQTGKLTVSFAPWAKPLIGISLLASLFGFGYLTVSQTPKLKRR